MKYITKFRNLHIDAPTVVAIGKFVGVHRGHQKLLDEVERVKKELGEPYESLVFMITGLTGTILPEEEKLRKLEEHGIDNVVECEFTEEIRNMSAETFLDKILLGRLGAKVIVAGPDVKFGHFGAGDAEFLRKMEKEKDFKLIIIEKEKYKGEDISSTRIKKCIEEGDMKEAEEMLGT